MLSEDSVLKWYNTSHSAKGKTVFLEQMKTFVEWLQNAEEGKHFKTTSVVTKVISVAFRTWKRRNYADFQQLSQKCQVILSNGTHI